MNNDDALEVEGRALPPIVTSSIRTITPYLVGYVLAAVLLVLRPLGVEIPAQAEEWLGGVLPLLLGSLYYVAARKLEQRWPSVPSTSRGGTVLPNTAHSCRVRDAPALRC